MEQLLRLSLWEMKFMQERDLAMFQDKLLKTLWTQDDPETIMNRLEVASPSEPMKDYVREMDQQMVELAAELVKRWGQKVD